MSLSSGDWNTIANTVNTGAAAIAQSGRGKKAHERSKELMGIQMENQMNLNRQGSELQRQMWENTNAPAQMKMLKEAGLNPALMYGKGGAGGTTTGSQGGGSAGSGTSHAPMDIGAVVNAAQAASQIALVKAQTEKVKEESQQVKINNEISAENKYADMAEGSVRYQKATGAQNAFLQDDTMYQRLAAAEVEKVELDTALTKAVKNGTISENEVKAYRASLANAQIDPDSNPVIREMMKAMAAEGKPLNEIIRKIVRFFID